MSFEMRSLLEVGVTETVQLLQEGFADYMVKIDFTPALLWQMVRQDGIDWGLSRAILVDGIGVGVALIARRGWTARLASMAVAPSARRRGLGRACVEMLLREAGGRGDRYLTLEVIEQNEPAHRLYATCGFQVDRRLVGYRFSADSTPQPPDKALTEVDIYTASRAVTSFGLPDLPWQISGESLAQLSPPHQAFRLGQAYAIISNPVSSQIAIRALVVEPAARRQGQAQRLIRALQARLPGKLWRVPVLCPEEVGVVFERAGFVPEAMTQLQMTAPAN